MRYSNRGAKPNADWRLATAWVPELVAEHAKHDLATIANDLVIQLIPQVRRELPISLDELVVKDEAQASMPQMHASASLPTYHPL